MRIVCPAVLASSEQEYSDQIDRVKGFAPRIQIDLTDGEFSKPKTIELDHAWWPEGILADLHLMYEHPDEYIEKLVEAEPNMVIVHAEASLPHADFAAELHKAGIKAGLAVLPQTSIESLDGIIGSFDHLLIFSGELGHFGGQADLSLLPKAQAAKDRHSGIEVGWDGGVNEQNIKQLIRDSVDVLNVGGFIQNAGNPREAYQRLLQASE